ncbi:unnamed protein product, partial [Ixodes hexagonus]
CLHPTLPIPRAFKEALRWKKEKRVRGKREEQRRAGNGASKKETRRSNDGGEGGERAAGSTTPDPRQGQAKCARPRPLAFTCAPVLHWPEDPVTSPESRQ